MGNIGKTCMTAVLTAMLTIGGAMSLFGQTTPHDFASVGEEEAGVQRRGVCMFCHKPHRSIEIPALWGLVGGDRNVYRDKRFRHDNLTDIGHSPSSQISFVCLSCHDEDVHSSGVHPVPTPAVDDPSRGIRMDLGESGRINGHLPVYNGMIECATCHDPHNHQSENYLRLSEAKLCSDCHEY